MVLTLEIKKDDPKTLILCWDGQIWRKLCKSLFFNDLNIVRKDLNWEDFYAQFSLLEKKIAKRYLLFLLSKRNYLTSQLEAKLLSKGFSPLITREAVLLCCEKGYVNDAEEMGRLFVKEMKKGQSARATYFKLKQKKAIHDSQLRQHLHQAELADKQNLQEWLKKHAGKIKRDDPKEMRKWIAKLNRRGFSLELILQALGP
jgi:SOS response regulatory protein OraA/RecX